ESNEQKKTEDSLGNDEAGKEKRPDGGEHAQAGIESGAGSPGPPCPHPAEPGQPQDSKRIGQVSGKGVLAKDAVGDSHQPVGQRGLLDVANAVDFAGDPVAALDDVLGSLGVG